MVLPYAFANLARVLNSSESHTTQDLIDKLPHIGLEPELQSALCEAAIGDNRKINAWLFAQKPGDPLAWIAPVKNQSRPFVWMIGFQTASSLYVHGLFKQAQELTANDELLIQRNIPPPLLFVDPVYASRIRYRETEADDEFAIFQVGYNRIPFSTSDLDQRMVINTPYIVRMRKVALSRLQTVVDASQSVPHDSLELYAMIHTEGHNQGHFVGAWPHDEVVKKHCVLYEAVEEFRACIASILVADKMRLSDRQKDEYALTVFATRFFGYGFDAFKLQSHRRETVREVTVGLMFFEWLRKQHAITLNAKGLLSVNSTLVRQALRDAFRSINEDEAVLAKNDAAGLRTIARKWYQIAFPKGGYSQESLLVYNLLGGFSRS